MSGIDLTFQKRVANFSTVLSGAESTDFKQNKIDLEHAQNSVCENIQRLKELKKRLYVIGNGGSAAVAAHAVTDLFNVAGIRATTLHESSLFTCMANDFGYENAFARMLEQLVDPKDILIAISSSGKSPNIINAARVARAKSAIVITLSGFSSTNELRALGDINLWLNSEDYGMIEIGHQFILHNIADRFNQKFA